MTVFKRISKINIFIFLIIIVLPLYLFQGSLFSSLFNFSFFSITTSILILYYFLIIYYIDLKGIKWVTSFLIVSLFCIHLLMLYSFVLDKDYTWKDLSSENFKKPLIIWLEKKLKVLQEEERNRHILTSQHTEVISDNEILKEEDEETYTEDEEIYTKDRYSNLDEYEDGYDDYSNSQSEESDYHYVEGYTRSDGTEVEGYVSGNPDGIEENNIEYMRDNGDQEGLDAAFSSIFD